MKFSGQPLTKFCTYEVAAGCVTETSSTTCAVHIEDCDGW